MPAQIDTTNNRIAMAAKADVDIWWDRNRTLANHLIGDETDDEALAKMGLDYQILQRQLFYAGPRNPETGRAIPIPYENRKVNIRSDAPDVHLGIVSENRYNVTQPDDSYRIIKAALEEGTNFAFAVESGGALYDGAKWWIAAKMNRTILADAIGDTIEPRLLASSGCDGMTTTRVAQVFNATVCDNTLEWNLGDPKAKVITIPHSTEITDEVINSVHSRLDDMARGIETFEQEVIRMANVKVNDDQVIQFYVDRYVKTDDNGNVTNEKTLHRVVGRLMNAYRNGPGQELDCRKGTVWGMVNGLTNFEDYGAQAQSAENRFRSSQWGKGRDRKNAAFAAASAFAQDNGPLATVTGEELTASLLNRPVSTLINAA